MRGKKQLMRYNCTEYSLENYKKLNKKITSIINDASSYFNFPIEKITHEIIENYCIEFYDYDYMYCNLSDKANVFLGNMIRNNGKTIIGINNNKNIPSEKKFHAKMHETTHSFIHCTSFDKSQDFNMLLHNFNYQPNEKIDEIEADLGGLIFMLNDEALYSHLKLGYSYSYLKDFFKLSDELLKTRLKMFLSYNCNSSELLSNIAIERFKSGDNISILSCVRNRIF